MARRGTLARLYDAVVGTSFAVGKAALSMLHADSGEGGMARMLGPYGSSGYSTNPLSKAEQVLHFRGWNYTCINYIATRVAMTAPTAVYAAPKREAEAHKFAQKAYLRDKSRAAPDARAWASPRWVAKAHGPAKPNEEYEFLDDSSPLVRLLQDPNDPETGVSVWYEAELYNCLTGEDYLWVVEGDDGRPAELWVIPSHWVRPVCLGQDKLVDYFEVTPRGSTAAITRFDPDEIIWNRRPSPLSKLVGCSPLQAQAATIDSYEMTEAARYFSLQNGAMVGGTIKVPPTSQLTPEIVSRLESRFLAKFAGVKNVNRPIILEGGAEYVPAPPEAELAFMQSMDQLRKYIMAGWGLDEVVLGFSSVPSRAAAVAAIYNVNESTINPRKKARAAVLTEKLAKRFDDKARIFYPDDTPLDPDSVRSDFASGAQLHATSANDYRTHVLGLEPWPEGVYDRPLISPGLANPIDTSDWDAEHEGDATNELRGTVGGLQAISGMQSQYYAGQIPRAAAVAAMQTLFGMSSEEAEGLFPPIDPVKRTDEGGGAGGGMGSTPPAGDDGSGGAGGDAADPNTGLADLLALGTDDDSGGLADDADLTPKRLTHWLKKDHGPPPYPGAVFDDNKHRWVRGRKDDATTGTPGGSGKPDHLDTVGGLDEHMPPEVFETPGLWERVKDAATTVAAKTYTKLVAATPAMLKVMAGLGEVFDTPDDLKRKFGYNPTNSAGGEGAPSTNDPLRNATGISTHLACTVASHVLAKASLWAKRKLRGKALDDGDGYAEAGELIANVFALVNESLGVDGAPTAEEVTAALRGGASAKAAKPKTPAAPKTPAPKVPKPKTPAKPKPKRTGPPGPPPRPGLVWNEQSRRWNRQKEEPKPKREAKPKPEPKKKPDRHAVNAAVRAGLSADPAKLTPAVVKKLDAAMQALTVADLTKLKKELSLKGGRSKQDHIDAVTAYAKARKAASKPAKPAATPRKPKPVPEKPPATQSPAVAAVMREYANSAGKERQAFATALGGITGYTPEGGIPADHDPLQLGRRLVSARQQAARMGATDAELAGFDRAMASAGIKPLGKPGETVPFSGADHESESHIPEGTPVRVVNPGRQMPFPDGDGDYSLARAKVEPIPKAGHEPKKPDAAKPTDVRGPVPAGHEVVADDAGNGLRVVADKGGNRTTVFAAGAPEAAAKRIGHALAGALVEVSADVENADGLIGLPSIVGEVKRTNPDTTDGEVFAALSWLRRHNAIEGHGLNEVRRLTHDPERPDAKPIGIPGRSDPSTATMWDRGRALHLWMMPRGGIGELRAALAELGSDK